MKIHANKLIDEFIEKNDRRWRSEVFENKEGQIIFDVTNPGIADWTNAQKVASQLAKKYLT